MSRESNGAGELVLNENQRRNQDVNEPYRETADSVARGMACGSHEPAGQGETAHARARCVGRRATARMTRCYQLTPFVTRYLRLLCQFIECLTGGRASTPSATPTMYHPESWY